MWRRGQGRACAAHVLGALLLVVAASCSGRSRSSGSGAGGTGGNLGGSSGSGGSAPAGAGGSAHAGTGGTVPGGGGVGGAIVSLGGAPGSPLCTPLDDNVATTTLDQFCMGPCPSAEEAVARFVTACSEFGGTVQVVDGCGYVAVQFFTGIYGRSFIYDRVTARIVGARSYDDIPVGPCERYEYRAGIVPGSCDSASACRLCGDDLDDAGAGGDGGSSAADCLPF